MFKGGIYLSLIHIFLLKGTHTHKIKTKLCVQGNNTKLSNMLCLKGNGKDHRRQSKGQNITCNKIHGNNGIKWYDYKQSNKI